MTDADRLAPLDGLRSTVVLFVLLLHALMAYFTLAPSDAIPTFGGWPSWAAAGVVDPKRWVGFDLVIAFIDIFCMALMFFVSGLFVSASLKRKGAFGFMFGRLKRLAIPFVFAAGIIAPMAYFPAWLQRGGDGSLISYWHAWLALPAWQAGPAWFLWVLTAFALLAALLRLIAPNWTGALAQLVKRGGERPWRVFWGLFLLSSIAYIGMSILFDPYRWLMWGPFIFQVSRILHYFVYFLAGVAVGAYGLSAGLLAADGRLARRWWLFALLALPSFILLVATIVAAGAAGGQPMLMWRTVGGIAFALSCALTSFALIGLFVRMVRSRGAVGRSLDRNAYGIYLVHYVFINAAQYALLPTDIAATAKGVIVFAAALLLSWMTAALLRRIPAIARII